MHIHKQDFSKLKGHFKLDFYLFSTCIMFKQHVQKFNYQHGFNFQYVFLTSYCYPIFTSIGREAKSLIIFLVKRDIIEHIKYTTVMHTV